ncbi:propanediol utilization protein PduL, partial [gut metagenome]
QMLQLKDKEHVSVKILSERPVTFDDVIIRVSPAFNFKMHIDFDEANAASVKGFNPG